MPKPVLACFGVMKPDLTVDQLTHWIRADPCNAQAYRLRGIALLCKSESPCWDCAICDFTESLRLNVKQPDVYALRGFARFNSPTPDCDRAIDDLDLALLLDPRMAYAYYWRAKAVNGKWRGVKKIKDAHSAAAAEQTKKKTAAANAERESKKAQDTANAKKVEADNLKDQANMALAEFAETQVQFATANQAVTSAIARGDPLGFNQTKHVLAAVKDDYAKAKNASDAAKTRSDWAKKVADSAMNDANKQQEASNKAQTDLDKANADQEQANEDLAGTVRELQKAICGCQEAICLAPECQGALQMEIRNAKMKIEILR